MPKTNKEKTPKGRFKAGDRILPVDFVRTDGTVAQWVYSPKDEYLTVIDVEPDMKSTGGHDVLRVRVNGSVSTFSELWFVSAENVWPKPKPHNNTSPWLNSEAYKAANKGSLSESYEDGYDPEAAALADTASLSDNGLANMGSLQSVIDETKEFAEWKKWKAAQAASKPSEEFTGRLFRGRE